MTNVIPIASTGAENADSSLALPSPPLARYRLALPGAVARWWRIARLTAEVTGWMLFAGLAALLIHP